MRDHVGQPVERHLDARRVAVVAHPQLGEPEPFQRGLGAIDLAEQGDGDLGSVRNATGQAGRRRLVPRAQAEALRCGADIGLGEPGSDQWERRAAFVGGALAGPVVAEVVEVDAEHDRRAICGRDRPDDIHQLRLAVVAAVGVVDAVRGALHLVGDHRRPAQPPLVRRGQRQSASSSPASDGDTAVTAWASSPRTWWATAARNALSAPPLNATTTRPRRRSSARSASILSSMPSAVGLWIMG